MYYAAGSVSMQILGEKFKRSSSYDAWDPLETCFYILETMSGPLGASQSSPPVVHELFRLQMLLSAIG